MDGILIKILAMALAFGQVVTRPVVRTEFDATRDRGEVVQLFKDGCKHMRSTFDIEDINVDELIETALSDSQGVTGENKAFRGINFADLHALYREFCMGQVVDNSVADLDQVIAYFNKAVADLPDHKKLQGLKLPGRSVILDITGAHFAETYEPGHRRVWLSLSDIPSLVQRAFIASEDRRFFEHKGIDERAMVRAFIGNLGGQRQGGSTITQQLVKNLLVGDDATYDRKMREMIVASRLERSLSKSEILELYLNAIYLGRGSWGIEMAAQSYFGKPAGKLDLAESALLAGLTKGPNYYAPDKHPERARQRLGYVLSRMKEDGAISTDEMVRALAQEPVIIPVSMARNETGLHLLDHVGRELKALVDAGQSRGGSQVIRATVHPQLQRATEAALQEGLARYELDTGRAQHNGAEANLSEAVKQILSDPGQGKTEVAWRTALERVRLPLHDVHWTPAVVVNIQIGTKGAVNIQVGLRDGQLLPLTVPRSVDARRLQLNDVVYVRVREAKDKSPTRAELRVRPAVQGAAVVLENKTGRILAMTGGFSYALSPLDRSTQARRQPGSTFKPLTYLAALSRGLQPNTLLWDAPIMLAPVGGGAVGGPTAYDWSPRNYDRTSAGLVTLRRALESSKNQVTAHLLNAITSNPEESLSRVCGIALEAQLYKECVPHYPFVLGVQPVRLLDLAAFYAAIANEGERPAPHAIEAVEEGGRVTPHAPSLAWVGSGDRVAFYQLRTMLQGVLERGTARSMRHLAPYVAGKTGTSNDENDAWFIGFTNDVTVGVWVGYDNAGGQRRTLGRGQTGAKVALPIFEQIIQAVWQQHRPRTVLAPPSPEVQRNVVALPIDLRTGDFIAGGAQGFSEQIRTDASGRPLDTQYRIVSREAAYAARPIDPWLDGDTFSPPGRYGFFDRWRFGQIPSWRGTPQHAPPGRWRPYAQPGPWWEYEERRRQERRIDPDYPWSFRRLF
jgi:penicillin-binding protein 1A